MSEPLTREQIIEQLKTVLDPWVVTHHHGCHEPADEDWGSSLSIKEPEELAEAALPVITRAITDRVRALHQPHDHTRMNMCVGEPCVQGGRCDGCGGYTPHSACPTNRLLGTLDAEMGVER